MPVPQPLRQTPGVDRPLRPWPSPLSRGPDAGDTPRAASRGHPGPGRRLRPARPWFPDPESRPLCVRFLRAKSSRGEAWISRSSRSLGVSGAPSRSDSPLVEGPHPHGHSHVRHPSATPKTARPVQWPHLWPQLQAQPPPSSATPASKPSLRWSFPGSPAQSARLPDRGGPG